MVQAGFARIAAALADPAREAMLIALADGRTLPAGELARAAGISPSGATAHLQKLLSAGLVAVWVQGRFRYYRLADEDVASAIEGLATLANRQQPVATRRRRVSPEICFARHCYNHLAGRLGVALSDRMTAYGYVHVADRDVTLTASGTKWLASEGISVEKRSSSPCIRFCLDWTERRPHFGGSIPAAILSHLLKTNCLARIKTDRALRLTPQGRRWFAQIGVDADLLHAFAHPSTSDRGDGETPAPRY